jgi:hypothetical protein
MGWGGLWGMIGVDKIGEIRRAYFEQHRSIKEIVKAAERSVESLWNRIACLLDAFQPDECANYLRNSGYAAS